MDVIREAEQAAERRIADLAEAMRRPGLQLETLVREGDPAAIVLDHASVMRPD